jgi:5'-deoxynucleotidase YfbR-like HD superfamily hydrolase
MNALQKRFTIALQLSSVSRFSRDYMQKRETVLEHIGFCVFYATLLARDLEKRSDYKIDYEALMRGIALHDLDESILGDIPRTTKYFSEEIRSEFKVIEIKTMLRLENWLESSIYPDWKNAKEHIEGQILKVADIAAVVFRNWAEIEMFGNRSFLRVCLETNEFLMDLPLVDFHPVLAAELIEIKKANLEILSNHKITDTDSLFLNLAKEDEK